MQFILDKSHLKNHLYETAEALGINQKDRPGWVKPRVREISDGNVEAVLKELEEENDKNPQIKIDPKQRTLKNSIPLTPRILTKGAVHNGYKMGLA